MNNFGLYVIITSPVMEYSEIAEICVKKGVKMLQIREKHLCDSKLLKVCREIKAITKASQTNFIVNDRVDIAYLSDADGVHLGQDDISIEEARKILGNDKIIGLSTHSIEQAKRAISQGPDYIGFGPIYPTPTKIIADPTVGTGLLKEVLEFSPIPVVAIGGIDDKRAIEVIKTSAKNICAVRYLMQSDDLANRIDYLNSLIIKS